MVFPTGIRSRCVLTSLVLLASRAWTADDVNGSRVYVNHPASPSMLYINEAVGSTRVHTMPNKNKLYELLLYPTKMAAKSLKSVAVLSGDIAGTLYLTQQKPPLGPVEIDGFVQDVEASLHVQVARFGDLSSSCSSDSLQLFNPYGRSHGRYEDPTRPLGDLGKTQVSQHHFRLSDRSVSLTGTRSVLGRLVVVSDGAGRTGCGVVGYATAQG
ncbi:superoxide dismutase [Cu-Zn]-like [Pollicipes pollicipes]|uniref:superoxide dismutase [Cu-Zn]-like n=1 Tax=Pollicipes pollicipes TaxID=41117 RepID=UPI0018850FD4|nr:superoxide dismutase [Cu-Zn]-like [Pollicipes pollicipes]